MDTCELTKTELPVVGLRQTDFPVPVGGASDNSAHEALGRAPARTEPQSEQLKIVIAGHVDHGKSTFVGRLIHDTGSLPEGKLVQLQQIARRRGVPFEWANLMDWVMSDRD